MKLKFTCPKCNHNELGSVEQVIMTYPVIEITDDDIVITGSGFRAFFRIRGSCGMGELAFALRCSFCWCL